MIKSPLRYPGGKSRAVDLIASLIPKFEEYREPFVGGGSVYIYLKQKYPTKKYWINDLYFELYKFWEMSQKDLKIVIKQIYEWKKRFEIGKELYSFLNENIINFNDTERAAAFFIYNRITFSGTSLSGGYSDASFVGRFTESSIQRLSYMGKIIDNTKISNYDYKKVVEEKGENVFLFLDPPYYSATKSALYGKNGNMHKSFDHDEFAETMKNCKHQWLITYDDSDKIRDLFAFANIVSWDLTYGMRNVSEQSNQIGKELFISNYPIKLPKQIIEESQMVLFEPTENYKKKNKKIA